jgi:hypothetical protein
LDRKSTGLQILVLKKNKPPEVLKASKQGAGLSILADMGGSPKFHVC